MSIVFCVCVCVQYLAAALARPVCAGTRLPLQVAGLAVGARHAALALRALCGRGGAQATPGGRYHQRHRPGEAASGVCPLHPPTSFLLQQTAKPQHRVSLPRPSNATTVFSGVVFTVRLVSF